MAISLIIILGIIVKGILFFTAEPKVTVDYLSRYNKLTQPTNYNPKNNAAEEYQKAFDSFVRMPAELRIPYIIKPQDFNNLSRSPGGRFSTRGGLKVQYFDWPSDLDDTNQNTLQQWLESNKQAFEYFRIASNKSYYWLERNANRDSSMISVMLPELVSLRQLADAIVWDVKMDATKGQFQPAFKDILSLLPRRPTQVPNPVFYN